MSKIINYRANALKKIRRNSDYATARFFTSFICIIAFLGSILSMFIGLENGPRFATILTSLACIICSYLVSAVSTAIYDAADAAILQRIDRTNDEEAMHRAHWQAQNPEQ